jgi:uracil phosphoribosyltransferase
MNKKPTESVNIVSHPLAKYWLTILRDRHTSALLFRRACTELSAILTYEALVGLPLKNKVIETPMESTIGVEIAQPIHVIPILRTGELLTSGVLRLCPTAHVLPIGLRRSVDGALVEYDTDLFFTDEQRFCLIIDGIVGTGHTLSRAVEICKSYWPMAHFSMICFVGLKTGFEYILNRHPTVNCFTVECDRTQNAEGYLLPGIGDIRGRAYNIEI